VYLTLFNLVAKNKLFLGRKYIGGAFVPLRNPQCYAYGDIRVCVCARARACVKNLSVIVLDRLCYVPHESQPLFPEICFGTDKGVFEVD
jgi:hypothetical protein